MGFLNPGGLELIVFGSFSFLSSQGRGGLHPGKCAIRNHRYCLSDTRNTAAIRLIRFRLIRSCKNKLLQEHYLPLGARKRNVHQEHSVLELEVLMSELHEIKRILQVHNERIFNYIFHKTSI